MTVEERARACAAEMGGGDIWDRAVEAIEKHLRDQIEDCAKALDDHLPVPVFMIMGYTTTEDHEGNERTEAVSMPASTLIRALAAPKEKGEENYEHS